MFEGDWHNLDSSQTKPVSDFPYFFDMPSEYFEAPPLCYFPPESAMDLQMFPVRRDEENKDTPAMGFFQVPEWCFMQEQAFTQINQTNEETPDANVETAKETTSHFVQAAVPFQHTKQVGTLTIEQRQAKIQRYLEKRRRRSFHKKVVYLCRKRVADTRLRVKGRFVAKHLAATLKGLENDKNNVTLPGEKRT